MSHNFFLDQDQLKSYIVKEDESGQRLDYTLKILFPNLGLRGRKRLWKYYKISVNNKHCTPSYKVRVHDIISISPLKNSSNLCSQNMQNIFTYSIKIASHKKFNILSTSNYLHKNAQYTFINKLKTSYFFLQEEVRIIKEDENYIFIYKPFGLHSVALNGSLNPCLESEILHLYPNTSEIILINRLDKETSGIVIAAHKSNIHNVKEWQSLENIGHCTKYYLALVDGHLDEEIIIKNDLDTNNRKKTLVLQKATQNNIRHTKVAPLAHFKLSAHRDLSLVACTIKKGARHQIRAHLASAGYALWGDIKYGGSENSSFILHHCILHFGQTKIICLPHWLSRLDMSMQNAIMQWVNKI